MLDSNVDSLGDDSVSDLLVDDDSDRSRIDIEDSSSSSVVVSVGHSLVDGSVDGDIDDVSDSVGGEGLGDVDGSDLSESLLEEVSSLSSISVRVSHFITRENIIIK